ncbi:alanine racemase [Luteimonas sp. MC1825]|uniref:alanine racemase n=1 Tax=Luteimonas sp. MC1825 TaxID=2761107 RepID=UPI00161A7472|nr:alanine racemase [Luteimonas sp. MC1825]MBB6599347.1 alanine racemase [Luteimonas sp. MC1825]QOC87060.1 alanine racemase [Luteimonas sp. MC1825]
MGLHAAERPTRILVDLDRIAGNLRAIRAHAGVPVMAIVKANAYGHGLVQVARHLQVHGVEHLGVAFPEEGIALRRAGISVPILVLGGIYGPQVAQYLVHDLEITVSSLEKLRHVEAAAASMGRHATVHLKIDTGMERIGVHAWSAGPFIEAAVASRWIRLAGIYSHLACADEPDSPTTALQLARFEDACAHFGRIGAPVPPRHIANSGGVLHCPDTRLDMVRPGILLYGVLPGAGARATVAVQPALSLVSRVVYFKVVQAGHAVSYGGTWAPATDTRVVTVPIGYGDGYPRALSSRGTVLLRGRGYPIVGRVCMDQFMVDIGRDSAWNEDEVVLIGRQGDAELRAEQVAAAAGMIPYEVLVGLNDRIPRVYSGGFLSAE